MYQPYNSNFTINKKQLLPNESEMLDVHDWMRNWISLIRKRNREKIKTLLSSLIELIAE